MPMNQTSPTEDHPVVGGPREDSRDEPLLSVVVPFYNVEAYIGDCLDSLQRQLLEDIEVVLVDDGSRDGSLDVAERFVAADARFRLVRQENQGLGPARNTGAAVARGRYITFVDSDDIVAPRAYTSMVGSMEQTGSSIAAGNAYRFSAHKGVYQSWTHREPFRTTKLRTSLDRFTPLVKDRMIWNKVYRRSFWDAGGYEFPPIRYEDYPVTLRAYLEAESVDILSSHVYLWRDRESGDSITQQSANADNARERFESARMVLQTLAQHEANDDVRHAVEAYFIHIDLVALAQSMVSVTEADRPDLERMALELAQLTDPRADDGVTRLARLIHRRLLAGDLAMVGELARWRLDGDTAALAKALASQKRPVGVSLALGAVVRRNRVQNPLRPRRLRSALREAVWDGHMLRLAVEAKLRGDLGRRVSPSAAFHFTDGTLPARVVSCQPSGDSLALELEVDSRDVAAVSTPYDRSPLELGLRLGPLTWKGPVRFTPELLPGVVQLSDGSWLQLGGVGLDLGLNRVGNPLVVTEVEAVGDAFVVHPHRSTLGATVVVDRGAPSPDIKISFRAGPDRLEAAALIDGDPPDNPVTKVAERRVWMRTDPPLPVLPLSKDAHPDDFVPDFGYEDVYLMGDGATIRVGEVLVSLARGWHGNLVVRQQPVEPVSSPDVVDAMPDVAVEGAPEELVASAASTTDELAEADLTA